MSPADFEESTALGLLDKGGKWQNKQIALLSVSTFAAGLQALVIVFIGFPPKFICADALYSNLSDEISFNDECSITNATTNVSASCRGGYVYEVERHESIVSDWDLVCDKSFLSETSQFLFTLGMGAGSAIVPPFSDRLGRRWTLIVIRIMVLLCSVGLALAPNIVSFMILRFLGGAVVMANLLVRYVYLMELSSVRFRPLVGVISGLVWGATVTLEACFAHLLRGVSWRVFQAVVSIPNLTVILDVIFIRESVLWLYANGRRTEASALVEEALKENRMNKDFLTADSEPFSANKETYPMVNISSKTTTSTIIPDAQSNKHSTTKQKVSIIDLIKTKSTRRIVPIISITWLTNSLVYYGIYMMSYAMPGDRILNVFLSAAVEAPSYLALYLGFRFLSRKTTLVCFHALCAVSLLLGGIFAATLEDRANYVMMQVVTFVGKFGISASYTAIYVYTTEVFPTNFRSSGLGIGSLSARCGAVLSSYAAVFAREVPWGPGTVFGTLCMIVTISLFWVPDTKDAALPQTMADVETLTKKKAKDRNSEVRIRQ